MGLKEKISPKKSSINLRKYKDQNHTLVASNI